MKIHSAAGTGAVSTLPDGMKFSAHLYAAEPRKETWAVIVEFARDRANSKRLAAIGNEYGDRDGVSDTFGQPAEFSSFFKPR